MRLVCESACQCNPRQPVPRGYHHEFGALDSSCRDIRVGRGCKALFECSREMTRAQTHEIGHVANLHLQSKMVLYVLDSPPGLASRETTGPQNAVRRRCIDANCFGRSSEESRGTLRWRQATSRFDSKHAIARITKCPACTEVELRADSRAAE
jgi:hypothetical protein